MAFLSCAVGDMGGLDQRLESGWCSEEAPTVSSDGTLPRQEKKTLGATYTDIRVNTAKP